VLFSWLCGGRFFGGCKKEKVKDGCFVFCVVVVCFVLLFWLLQWLVCLVMGGVVFWFGVWWGLCLVAWCVFVCCVGGFVCLFCVG